MRVARARAIEGHGPTLIECKTYRYLPHTSDDDDKSYRSREEVDRHRHDDPIERFSRYLTEHGVVTDDDIASIRDELKSEVDRAITDAWAAPDPEPASATRHVFAEGGRA
jgi:2-oxoisovalerate dehydrogenase E1 component alpha subunit